MGLYDGDGCGRPIWDEVFHLPLWLRRCAVCRVPDLGLLGANIAFPYL